MKDATELRGSWSRLKAISLQIPTCFFARDVRRAIGLVASRANEFETACTSRPPTGLKLPRSRTRARARAHLSAFYYICNIFNGNAYVHSRWRAVLFSRVRVFILIPKIGSHSSRNVSSMICTPTCTFATRKIQIEPCL